MRNREFIAQHRGGPLSKENHVLLILWAADCAEHVLYIFQDVSPDDRPHEAIKLAREWANGNISVGDARNAAFAAHHAARDIKEMSKAACEAARAAGHAVATAHMGDHCLQVANYALKAISNLSQSIDKELKWQNDNLPEVIQELVLNARKGNAKN